MTPLDISKALQDDRQLRSLVGLGLKSFEILLNEWFFEGSCGIGLFEQVNGYRSEIIYLKTKACINACRRPCRLHKNPRRTR